MLDNSEADRGYCARAWWPSQLAGWWEGEHDSFDCVTFLCRCPMKGRTLGAAAVGFMLLCVCFLGSTKSPHTGGSSQGQERATRRTLIGRQEEVELLDSEVVQQEIDGVSQEESFYMPWIKQDFAVWEEEGIKQVRDAPCPLPLSLQCLTSAASEAELALACVSQSLVAEMAMRYRECFGEVFRFQIINGTLWVDHISERHGGWYPSQDGEGDPRTCLHMLLLEKGNSLHNTIWC